MSDELKQLQDKAAEAKHEHEMRLWKQRHANRMEKQRVTHERAMELQRIRNQQKPAPKAPDTTELLLHVLNRLEKLLEIHGATVQVVRDDKGRISHLARVVN